MTKDELKKVIFRILENFPEEKLEEVYANLKVYQDKSEDNIKLAYNLNKILKEDHKLLERLAK